MKPKTIAFAACLLAGAAITVAGIAQQSGAGAPAPDAPPTEAPAGFLTPLLQLKPGSQSVSNGIPEPHLAGQAKDTFAIDQQNFEEREGNDTGLGPVYNATSCADCHQNPVTGGPSQMTEVRVGHNDANGNFVNPTIVINHGLNTITGRSLVNDRAICPQAEEHVPATENIRTLRAALNTLGDGFVEAIDDATIQEIANQQPGKSNGQIHGETVDAPVFEAPGVTRIGRFGWKDQHGSVLSFAADAYLNEMGVTNALRPTDITTVCNTDTTSPQDTADQTGLTGLQHFAQFIRGTRVPPRDARLVGTPDVVAGEALFKSAGCSTCHVETIRTAPPGTLLNGGTFTVPVALGNKIIHPYGDFLLHDVGTGDGIVQVGPQDTADKLRTPPLWGLRAKSRLMHDLKSLSTQSAILRHGGEASAAQQVFKEMTPEQKNQLLLFLQSL
jgi:CxxC motif-containing protein (DUF1111 family)